MKHFRITHLQKFLPEVISPGMRLSNKSISCYFKYKKLYMKLQTVHVLPKSGKTLPFS